MALEGGAAEAIAALRCGDSEAHQRRGRFNEVVAERQLFNRKYLRFEAGNAMLYEYLMHTVVVAVLMAPSTWRKDGGQAAAGGAAASDQVAAECAAARSLVEQLAQQRQWWGRSESPRSRPLPPWQQQ